MTKKIFATMFALLAIATTAQAQFSGGSGQWHDPYIIKTIDDMTKLANDVNGGNDYFNKHFRLESDLDYEGKTYVSIPIAVLREFSTAITTPFAT